MANARYQQFVFNAVPMLTTLNGAIVIGATGAVSSTAGNGIYSVTRLTAGIYQVKLKQNFPSVISGTGEIHDGISGSAVSAGSFVTGQLYQIVTLGTTTQAQWVTAGVDADYTAAVGMPFVAAAAGAGNGTVKAIYPSGYKVEFARTMSSMLNNLNTVQGKGASFIIQCTQDQMVQQNGATHTNTTLDTLTSTKNLAAGMIVSGTGIPLGTVISSVDSATAVTISQAATASATVSTVIGPAPVIVDPPNGSTINFRLWLSNSSVSQ